MYVLNQETFDNNLKKIIEKKYNLNALYTVLEKLYPERWEANIITNVYYEPIYYKDNKKRKKDIGNNFDIRFWLHNITSDCNIIIHFPEIEITDGTNKHTIKDLYVQLEIELKRDYLDLNLYGIRGSVSSKEALSNYGHSHFCGINQKFSSFCLGSGPLSNYKTILSGWNSEDWEYYFILLNDYLKWESIEGTPYRYIANIGKSNNLERVAYNTVKNYFYPVSNITYKVTDKKINVLADDNLERKLVVNLPNVLKCYKSNDGKYYSNNASYVSIIEGNTLFTFKGKKIIFKIIKDDNDNAERIKYNAPNPEFTKQYCILLSKKLTEACIKRGNIRKEDITEDSTISVGEDSLF